MYLTYLPYLSLGLAALILLMLYFWQHRSSKLVVPALFLWDIRDIPPQAGFRWKLTRLPFAFYLELLFILLVALAAAGPFFLRKSDLPVLCVILDDSFSMQATCNGSSAKEKQLKVIQKALAHSRETSWIVAGSTPRKIPTLPGNKIPLADWKCQAQEADIQGAIALARSISKRQNLLVVTDHKPDFALPEDVHWSATGAPLDNVAIVNARRNDTRILLEIFNGANQDAQVSILANGILVQEAEIAPRTTTKLEIPADKNAPQQVTLQSANDPLTQDNSIVLLPFKRPPLSYRIQENLPSEYVALLRSTLAFSKEYIGLGTRELVIGNETLPHGPYHRLLFHTHANTNASVSPATITVNDRYETLTRGLSWNDLQWEWHYFKELPLPGDGVAFQGETPLLSVHRNGSFYDIHMNLNPLAGNLPSLPFWPSFFWNVSDFLRLQRPGPDKQNLRIDEQLTIHIPAKEMASLDGTPLHPVNGVALCSIPSPGIHELAIGPDKWRLAVNPLSQKESDLSDASTMELLPTQTAEKQLASTRNRLDPLVFILAIAILLAHWFVINKRHPAPISLSH